MKKIVSILVTFAILLTLSTAVFAAAPVTSQNEDGSWTTSGEDPQYASDFMTLVAITAAPVSVDSIQYIALTEADDNGAYSFENYLPKQTPESREPYIVLVGGEDIDTPLNAGTLVTETTTVLVSGNVSKGGIVTGAKIRLLNGQGVDVLEKDGASFVTNADGSFSFEATPGTYTLEITKAGHTKYVCEGLTLALGSDIKNATYTIYAGELTNDSEIATPDILKVIRNFTDSVTEEKKEIDITEDSVIDIKDVTTLIANILKKDVRETAQVAQ